MSLFVKESGVWAPVNSLSVHNGGAFVPVKNAFVKKDGAWSQYFTSEGGSYPTDELGYYEFEPDHFGLGSVKNLVTGEYDSVAGYAGSDPNGKVGNAIKGSSAYNTGTFRVGPAPIGAMTVVFWYLNDSSDLGGFTFFDWDGVLMERDYYGVVKFTAKYENWGSSDVTLGEFAGWTFIAFSPGCASRNDTLLFHNSDKYLLTNGNDALMTFVDDINFKNNSKLDQYRIYDRHLSDEEILQLYNEGNGTPLP